MADSRKAERREVDVSRVEIVAYCHATEDCERVEASIKNLLHPNLRSLVKILSSQYEGYYGNPIRVLTAKLSLKPHVNELLSYVAGSLDKLEKAILKSTFDLRFDPSMGRLVIRFSKQDLYLGKLKITDSDDVVKFTIYFKNAGEAQRVLEYAKKIGLVE